ncbi:ribonucleotide-diphosphate reductase subunit beta [Saccharopolyspora hordei]|uniref:Ribonucleotide reductase beta subunit family protein with ferritin-like domain n=1 Tax=Saccharopolyspora hordei TaxID=1838 RepID=A0A853APQ2_9PSEU|nr:ribonucleotide-diphosphate reductase subunit beta [Saccharopolyspora hordei]NYI82307.1 ribonucleotide reductase beta subunit family protein with ferritin-like domain [Saccharopolyspora hordei]
MSRWTPLLMDEVSLSEMPKLPVSEVMRHAHLVAEQRLKPKELYERWERQQWSAVDIPLEQDRHNFDTVLKPGLRKIVAGSIATFIIGEYTGLDMLGPIITGSPDEQYSVFLGTQIADETRHTHLVFRLGEEILGMDADPKKMLVDSWQITAPAHRELSLLEAGLVSDLQQRPLDYARWLRAVTLFHMITEGVLALVGQRVLVQTLRDLDLLDGIKTAFTAMCRDESRHVGFGMHALRTGVQEGHHDDICEVLEKAVPLALRIDEETAGAPSAGLRQMSIDILRRHMKLIGIDEKFQDHLVQHSVRTADLARTGAES